MADLIQISCPYCKAVMDVQRDWEGCDGECPDCHNVFRISIPRETEETKVARLVSHIAEIPNEELLWTVEYFKKKSIDYNSSNCSAFASQVQKIQNEIRSRKSRAKDIADAEKKKSLGFPLSIFATLICKHRKPTQLELFWSGLELQTQQQLDQLYEIKERARWEAEAKRRYEQLARKKNEVGDFAALVHRLRDVPPIDYLGVSYQQNEHPCLVLNGVSGVSCSKVGESYSNGTLVITNKRIFFTSRTHKQVYRLHNLVEYFSNWDYYNGTLKLSTSEKRSEQYQANGIWKAAFIVSFFCDGLFRQSILQGTEEQARAKVLSKVEASINRGKVSHSGDLLEVKKDGRLRSNDNDDPFKDYVDVSEKGLIGGMCAAFSAGLHGKGIITGWDKMTWYKPKESKK